MIVDDSGLRATILEEGLREAGFDCADAVVVPDGGEVPEPTLTSYRPSAHPGARLPHAWLADGSSVYDRLGDGFSLLRVGPDADTAPFREAAASAGVPLTVVDLPVELRRRYSAELVLVRPDQHVAWRGDAATDPAGVLAAVTGRARVTTAAG